MLACEILVVAAAAYPAAASPGILHTFCQPGPTPDARALASLHPIFVCGAAMLAFGSLGRIWCYRTLGRLFTFELSVRPNHVLVTTGPYALVRHPSCTAAIAVIFAFPLLHLAPGSWACECAASAYTGWLLATAVYLATISWAIIALAIRGPVEDLKLRGHFGDTWVGYRRRVCWAYIPFVY
jgi:protein-S-isoprenylcysteine O-methyltransferase Ste14